MHLDHSERPMDAPARRRAGRAYGLQENGILRTGGPADLVLTQARSFEELLSRPAIRPCHRSERRSIFRDRAGLPELDHLYSTSRKLRRQSPETLIHWGVTMSAQPLLPARRSTTRPFVSHALTPTVWLSLPIRCVTACRSRLSSRFSNRGQDAPEHPFKRRMSCFFVLSGSGTAICGGKRFPVAPGTVLWCDRLEHIVENPGRKSSIALP